MTLPTNRTTANTDVEHVADHNTAHGTINDLEAEVATKAADSAVVHKAGSETITGTKTFSTTPVVPNSAWLIAKTAGLQAALDAKAADSTAVHKAGTETITGTKTFSVAPVVPDDAWTIAKTQGLQDALDDLPLDGSVVHDTGDETVAGIKTFTSSPIVPTPTTAFQAAPKGYVNAEVTAAGLRVEDEGGTVVAAAKGINFAGASVTVTDAGSNEALVTIAAPAAPGTTAVGTPGGVDDTALIHTAKAAAGIGGTVVFPAGYVYLVDGLTASVANQHWVVMPGATVKTKNGADTPTIDVTADGVTIDGGGTLDGNRANQSDATTGVNSCVRIVSRSRVKVRNLTMRDSLSHCVYIDASSKVQVRNNEISGCGPAGNQKQVLVYDTVGSSSDIRISGNTVDSTGSTNGCIAITTSVAGRTIRKLRITGNTCYVGDAGATATLGIELFTSGTATISDARVSNNHIEGPAGVVATDNLYGISIGGTASNAANGVHTVTCVDNTVNRCPTAAIEIVGNGVTCTGNSATSSGAISVNAISTTGGLVGTTVVGNTSVGCVNLAYALFLEGGANGLHAPVVTGNTITGAASASTIATAGTITGAIISGNTVRDCDGVALNLGGTFTDSIVDGNHFDLTGTGATIDGVLIGSTSVARVGINGNTIKGAGRNGIYGLVATSDIRIRNNDITGCDTGLKTDDVATRWTVVGNAIHDNVDRGLIFATAGVDLAIASNTIHDNPGGDYYTVGSTFLTHVVNGSGG